MRTWRYYSTPPSFQGCGFCAHAHVDRDLTMAREREGRGTALGLLPGRLRGGFTASPIPRSSTLIDTASCSPLSPENSPSPSLTDSVSGSSSSDTVETHASIILGSAHVLTILLPLRFAFVTSPCYTSQG